MAKSREYDCLFKIIIIGNSGVGKTNILTRFADDKFDKTFITTIGIDFRNAIVNVDNKKIKLQIWDTAGQERFRTITSAYYRGVHAIIFTYDVTNIESFEQIREWSKSVDSRTDRQAIMMLIGNKVDLEEKRVVSKDDGQKLADELTMTFMETSALTGSNIQDAFKKLVQELVVNKSGFDEYQPQYARCKCNGHGHGYCNHKIPCNTSNTKCCN